VRLLQPWWNSFPPNRRLRFHTRSASVNVLAERKQRISRTILIRSLMIQACACAVNPLNPPRLAVSNRRELRAEAQQWILKQLRRLNEH
jgi:hypothetical protein